MNTNLRKFLDKHISGVSRAGMLKVFPLPCGVGKSEYIKYLISDALNKNYGLIVVTDEVERLNSYTAAQDEQLTEYIQRNIHRISILNSSTIATEAKILYSKPIVLMCTQRYFDLSIDEIKHYTATRKKIIFDEKPYIFVTYKLTIEALNNVDSALKEGLDDTVNQSDKALLVSGWETISTALQTALKENEALNTDYKREEYFNFSTFTDVQTAEVFFSLVGKYKSQLRRYSAGITKIIDAVEQLMTEGVITSQKAKYKNSGNSYDNYFTVLINNIHKLTATDAAVFVLDGTSDISPEYDLNCVKKVDCHKFQPDLRCLTINIVNVNTSKDRLTKSGDKIDSLIETIIEYIKSQPQNINTVFTYKGIADNFKDLFDNVNWFGNIKGTNQYREVCHICQVGLNRYPDLTYMLYANAIGQFNNRSTGFNNRIYDKETIDDIRCRLILADIEQNLYRCKIRNKDNKENCTYTLVCNVDERSRIFEAYRPLLDMIKARYKSFGATVRYIETPVQFKLLKAKERKTQNKTTVQKFEEWIRKQPEGRIFKRADIMSECNINESQFKDLKNTDILNGYKTEKQGVYKVM